MPMQSDLASVGEAWATMCASTARYEVHLDRKLNLWSYNGRSSVNGNPRRLSPQSASPVVARGGRLRLDGGYALCQ